MRWWPLLLAACAPVVGTPIDSDAGALGALGPPEAAGDLVVSASTPEGATLTVSFAEAPVAEAAASGAPRAWFWPIALEAWGSIVLEADGRRYEGIEGDLFLRVTPGDPALVDLIVEGGVLLGDAGAVAVPRLTWDDVPAE